MPSNNNTNIFKQVRLNNDSGRNNKYLQKLKLLQIKENLRKKINQ